MEMDRVTELQDVQKAVAKYSYIRFTVLDMNGVPRGCILPSSSAVNFLESGVGCFSALVAFGPNNEIPFPKEVIEAHCGNVSMVPDLSTLHPVPWLPEPQYKTAQLLCQTYWDKSKPQEACSRTMVRQLLRKLEAERIKIYSGTELEYSLIDKKSQEPVFSNSDYMSVLIQSEFHSWITKVAEKVSEAGISLERMHCEYSPGQFEFTTVPMYGIRGSDAWVVLKQALKEMANLFGWEANFMAKRYLSQVGNGNHFSFSLWDTETEENRLWDASSEDKLSKLAKHWIAGMIHHAKALTALCCPTENCYFRLHTPWTPHLANWGVQDRNAMLRVKNTDPKGTYIENRLPSGLANPYLVMAATVAAGLDGIKRELDCPPPHTTGNALELPHTLKEALDALQEDKIMVDALGKTFVQWFVLSKTDFEIKAMEGITDSEELLKVHIKKYARLL